jgi:hypothetical protein
MVAANGQVFPPHQEIAHLARPKRARNAIAKVDRAINAMAFDVGEDGFKRRQVAVDVGYDSNTFPAHLVAFKIVTEHLSPTGPQRNHIRRRPSQPPNRMPAGIAVCVIENAKGEYGRIAHLPSNCGLAGVATAATPFPTSADKTKPAAPPITATAIPPPTDIKAIWLKRMAPWRMMNPPDPS